ncbi:MAG TPA: hypothetical protein EYN06_02415 [Myxococcales bacterium]|nr:hypothetical protein [Myxococcales bacterium]
MLASAMHTFQSIASLYFLLTLSMGLMWTGCSDSSTTHPEQGRPLDGGGTGGVCIGPIPSSDAWVASPGPIKNIEGTDGKGTEGNSDGAQSAAGSGVDSTSSGATDTSDGETDTSTGMASDGTSTEGGEADAGTVDSDSGTAATGSEPPPAGRADQSDGGDPGEDLCGQSIATCVGAMPPVWTLSDFQPQSCGHRATYGLDVFKGKVTVMVLLAAW